MLPIYQDGNKNFMLMQTNWASNLNPILNLPWNSGLMIKDISIVSGDNVINHRLGRKLQGWIISGMHNAFAQIFDQQQTNSMSDKTLILNSSGSTTIDLIVF